MFFQAIHLMPTVCTCKQTSCKVIMIEHYPCSIPSQFFLFPVLRHNIQGENLHHPHMPSADVYSNKSSMWFFFTSSCASENNPKSHAASVHSHMHMVFFLGALPTCSLFHARGLLEWLLCSVCPAHPLYSASILYKLSRKSNLLNPSPSASFPLCLQYHLIVIEWGMTIHNLWQN